MEERGNSMRVKSVTLIALAVAFALSAAPVAVYSHHRDNHTKGETDDPDSNLDPAILTINDGLREDQAVFSDFDLSGRNSYIDQSIENSPDPCVVSTVSNTGLFWADMVANCDDPPVPPRTYILRFFSKQACEELFGGDPAKLIVQRAVCVEYVGMY